jgi:membrane-bound serine protease (ClpP class)
MRRMASVRRSGPWLLLACILAATVGPVARAEPVTPIRVLEVDGPIDRTVSAYLRRELADAEAVAAVVVLQVDTPGALGQDGIALADRVASSEVPVVAWVGPTPARASGAGLLLMLAASASAVAPGSQTGPLLPIDVLRPGASSPDLRSRIEGWLRAHGRVVNLGALSRPLTGREALDAGVAEAAGYTVPEVLRALDGTTVRASGGEVVLRTRVATTAGEARDRTVELRFVEPGLLARVLHAVGTPSMVYLLLVLGFAALAFELTQPGFGFAGFSGVFLLVLAGYGLTVAVPWWPGLALLVGGVVLMAVDVRLRSLSWPTWTGLAAFTAGSWLAWAGVDASIRIDPWAIGAAAVASLLYYGFALTVALQSRDRIVGAQRGLIGLVGEARGRLAPDGPVLVKGALWRGRSTGSTIEPGTPVRVRGVDGLILRVEEESAPRSEVAGA